MAKTKEQRAVAHQCQHERNARKRQRRNVLESTQQRTLAHVSTGEPSGASQALPRKQQSVFSQRDVEEASSGNVAVPQHTCVTENCSSKKALLPPISAEITGRRRCTDGGHETKFIISLTGLDRASSVERSYADFEALLTQVQPMMPGLPAMPPNTLQHVCSAGRYVEMRERGLQDLLDAMLEADTALENPQLRKFVLADTSEARICDYEEAAEELQAVEFKESNEGELLFPSAKSEVGGETDGQELHVISTGEEESTQGMKEAAASLAQAAKDKLEEPNAALVEIISGRVTKDEPPISSDSMEFLESREEDLFLPSAKSEEGGETDIQEIHDISTGEEEYTQGMKEPAASLAQVAEDQQERPNAAVVEIISDWGATADEPPISSDSMDSLESNEEDLSFSSAKSEEGGETDRQEIHDIPTDISTGEKESTRGQKEPVASLAAQAAEGKLEEPNAAMVETISDGEATADELPISSDSSGDEDDEEVCRAVEELSDFSLIECFKENGTAHVCVVCAGSALLLDEKCPLCEEGGEADGQETHDISTGEEEYTQGMKEPAASVAQDTKDKLEEPNAALVEIISYWGVTTDRPPVNSDSMEFLESREEDLFFPSAKAEEGGETDRQEIHDISTGEKGSARGKKEPVASLAQAAEDKLEEPNAALVETISDGEVTADEFPTSSDSSCDEADEEVCRAVEELSDFSVIEVSEEKGTAHVCVVCAGSGLLLDETCPLCDELELEWRNAAVQYYTSESDAATDELQVMSSRCNGDIDDMERTGAVELPSSLSAELDRVIRNLSAHMNSLTESVRIDEVPIELEIVDLDSQDPAHEISILARPHVEESHNSALASALHAYGTAYEAVVRFKFGGPQPSVPAAALHEAGKVKLQIHDLNGAVRNFAEAEAIHRQMGTLKTLAGAHLLLDIGVANLASGEIDDALEACGGICEFAGVLRTPASMKFLHEVVSLPCQCGSLDGVHKILAAAYTFMENVHKAEFETFVSRWSQILRSPIGRFFGECS